MPKIIDAYEGLAPNLKIRKKLRIYAEDFRVRTFVSIESTAKTARGGNADCLHDGPGENDAALSGFHEPLAEPGGETRVVPITAKKNGERKWLLSVPRTCQASTVGGDGRLVAV